jgi:hypothetical protein
LVTHRVTRPTEFERQVADQAPEKEVTGLVFVGELVEETRDPLLRRILRLEDGRQPLLDVGPVVLEDRRGKRLLACEVGVERPLAPRPSR